MNLKDFINVFGKLKSFAFRFLSINISDCPKNNVQGNSGTVIQGNNNTVVNFDINNPPRQIKPMLSPEAVRLLKWLTDNGSINSQVTVAESDNIVRIINGKEMSFQNARIYLEELDARGLLKTVTNVRYLLTEAAFNHFDQQ